MAVNGSDLQLAAQAYGRNRQGQGRGEGQARNRNADNRNENQANNDNRRNEDANANDNNANADNRRNENAANDRRENNQEQQAHQQAVHQLRVQAWRQFENGERLLRDANATLGAEANNAAGAARDDSRSAWTRRLHTASEQYATTLRALTGVGNREPQASGSNENQNQANRERDRADANQNQNQNQNQANRGNDNQNERSGWLNRGEAAQVALLNQAVRESIEAFELNQSHHQIFGGNQAAAVHASAQRLQEHARQMSADSQQLVQQVQAGLNNQQANQDRDRQGNQDQRNANARNQGDNNNNNDNRNNDNNRQGRASVRLLAQQAQQVIETLQRINSGRRPARRGPVIGRSR